MKCDGLKKKKLKRAVAMDVRVEILNEILAEKRKNVRNLLLNVQFCTHTHTHTEKEKRIKKIM